MKNYTMVLLALLCFPLVHAQIFFEEKAIDVGINITGSFSTQLGGVSFYDYDNDGWDDITFASKGNFSVRFFKNNAGTFVEETFNISIPGHSKQVLWVDYDNDGDNDLFVARLDAANKLYNNDGNFNFTDVSGIAGIPSTILYTYGACFGDYDNDGDLDLFLSNKDDAKIIPNQLYRNNGDGTFTDVSLVAGISTVGHLSFCASFFDYDNDGFLDIYISNDRFVNTNILYKNNGNGTFTDVSASSGAGVAANAMSTTIDDYNYDGFLDIYVTNTPEGNHLLQNNGDGTFTDVATATGTIFNSIGWGANFFDADNDMDLDLYVSSMINNTASGLMTSGFYECATGYNYSVPTTAGFTNDTFTSFSNAIGDVNNDGYQDFVVVNQAPENHTFWRNAGGTNNWLKVKLQGTTSNKAGIGAKIKATVGGQVMYRYVLCGEGFLGQNSATEIFGVGAQTTIDMLEIFWPSGIQDTYTNITANQVVTAVEGSSLGINEENAEKFSVYPNPASDVLYVSSTVSEPYTVTIFDSVGKKLFTQHLQNRQANLDVSSLASGLFFVEIRTKTAKTVQKIVIQ
ncbi:putative secreted protein (Por secretion system target) [Kordia periserrulae]|uniref:Putative secreted protein (Por secretion system target) n=1 Tax=Kordia periserrulae TaxID=701523 RepID=A0A2T6BZY3_9FLAO|nr:FG-GAP-like repeat-containing protein [Kordia periserrulae]PTX61620.1 putative secreted protein (Por secretion system target) [Kordia periserrulae]